MMHDMKLNASEIEDFIRDKEIEVASTTHKGSRLKLVRRVSVPVYKVTHGEETLVTTPSLNHAINIFEEA